MSKVKEKAVRLVSQYADRTDAEGYAVYDKPRGVHSSSFLTYLVTAICATVALVTKNIDANIWLGAITLDGIAYKVGRGLKR